MAAQTDSSEWLAHFLGLHPKSIDLSLGRIERLLADLSHPDRRLPPVIHVAGTNGKGSTIAFLRAILEAAGFSVHVYTSPHLIRFHERIRLGRSGGGALVNEEKLAEAFARCEAANGGAPITLFEITTAAAFLLFAEHPADVLLVEVGLGGRLDATNVIASPLASVITSIGFDHMDYLGSAIDQIAAEKAGIFKPGSPAIIAPQMYEVAEQVLVRRAERTASRVVLGGQEFHAFEEGGRFVYQDEQGLLDLPLPKLVGPHQYVNAGTAIATLRHCALPELPYDAFERGMVQVEWPGRLQAITFPALLAHLPKGSELWFDGAHNADGAKVLATALAEMEDKSPKPLVLIVGMLETKDAKAWLSTFKDLARTIITVPIPDHKGMAPLDLATLSRSLGLESTPVSGIDEAFSLLQDQTPVSRVVVTGSLYLHQSLMALASQV